MTLDEFVAAAKGRGLDGTQSKTVRDLGISRLGRGHLDVDPHPLGNGSPQDLYGPIHAHEEASDLFG